MAHSSNKDKWAQFGYLSYMHTSFGVWLGMDPIYTYLTGNYMLTFANFASFKNLIGWEGRAGKTYKIICDENLKLEFEDE